MTILIALLLAGWFAVGVWGFVFWWTKDYDLTTCEIPCMLICGLIGPLSWAGGWMIHGDGTTLMKRRGSR